MLSKYSKKRQSDLIGFAKLILYVIYLNHIMACIWIYLGYKSDCVNMPSDCIQSWVFNDGFIDQPVVS